jgi:hypothetical protein
MWGTGDNPVPKRRHLGKPDGQEFAHFRLIFSHSNDKNRLEVAVSCFGYTEVSAPSEPENPRRPRESEPWTLSISFEFERYPRTIPF